MDHKKVLTIFKRFAKANPNPVTELNYHSDFELLVAVLLSAHTTDKSVNKATATLFKVANTPDKIVQLGEAGLREHIKGVGLYNTKAKNLMKTCQILVAQYNSEIPNSRETLEALPGVGRKTASVVLSIAFKELVMAVDTHIFRVANRTALAPGKTPLAVEKKLLEVVPSKYVLNAHHWLILHGRYVCVARKPRCSGCLINDVCEFNDKMI